MNQEFNQIIMKNGKSKLLHSLAIGGVGDTVLVFIGVDEHTREVIAPDNIYDFYIAEEYETAMQYVHDLKYYSRIIFYSNKSKSDNIKYVHRILKWIKSEKCIFMFGSEM